MVYALCALNNSFVLIRDRTLIRTYPSTWHHYQALMTKKSIFGVTFDTFRTQHTSIRQNLKQYRNQFLLDKGKHASSFHLDSFVEYNRTLSTLATETFEDDCMQLKMKNES